MIGQELNQTSLKSEALVQKAARIAASDFEGILRKVPKNSNLVPRPYFSHVERVANLLAEHGYPPEVVAAGYLHDHLEDLPRKWNSDRLSAEFGVTVSKLVNWVTHRRGAKTWEEKSENYFSRIESAPVHSIAISAADKLANMEDLVAVMRQGYPVSSVLKRGWRENSEKFHRLLTIFKDQVHPNLVEKYQNTLLEFDHLGQAMEPRAQLPRVEIEADHSPKIIQIPKNVRIEISRLKPALLEYYANLNELSTQHELRHTLMANDAWGNWILPHLQPILNRPILVERGLGFERDDALARVLLVGLALTIEPGHICPLYSIGNQVVTDVMATPNATALSHSQNDLPAPPHTAGFFEQVPPHTCYFCCIRPHPLGGAATTVVNVARILAQAPQALIDEWESKPYLLRTSTRMGGEILPFQLLRWIEGAPFLRYRKECMVGFEQDSSLRLLEELIQNPANHFVIPLQAGETLIHWNGFPHSRLPQNGATPSEIEKRRKLIRCRTIPEQSWSAAFENGSVDGA